MCQVGVGPLLILCDVSGADAGMLKREGYKVGVGPQKRVGAEGFDYIFRISKYENYSGNTEHYQR